MFFVAEHEGGIAVCPKCDAPRFKEVRRNSKTVLEPSGYYRDFGIVDVLKRLVENPESAVNKRYQQDLSKNAFLFSEFGLHLKDITNGAIADPSAMLMDVGIDGIQLTKFKHHSTTVVVARVSNVAR